jgi:hypothetical protein
MGSVIALAMSQDLARWLVVLLVLGVLWWCARAEATRPHAAFTVYFALWSLAICASGLFLGLVVAA